jgi:outer membrane protein OmpA-like peptidoglycan-associated protein
VEGQSADEGLEAASESRMSADEALRDPKAVLEGRTRLTLDGDLLFAFDEDQLRPEAEPRLRQVAKLLVENPHLRAVLEGHADTIGGDQYNQALSERRAQALRSWLIQRAHVSPLRLDTVGYGNAKPVVPASRGPAAQAPNRRVEVRILPP